MTPIRSDPAAKLRSEALSKLLDDWADQHGPLTSEELRKAEAELAACARGPVSALVLEAGALLAVASGVTACDNLLAMEVAGIRGADRSHPIETG